MPANDKANDFCSSLQHSQLAIIINQLLFSQLAQANIFLITLVCLVCRPFICSILLYFVINLYQIRTQVYSSRHERYRGCDIPLKRQKVQKWTFFSSFYKCSRFEYHGQCTSRICRRNINLMQQFTLRLPVPDIASTAPFTCSSSSLVASYLSYKMNLDQTQVSVCLL